MKRWIILLYAWALPYAHAQTQKVDQTTYDFWVGNWELTWTDQNGGEGKGKNRIEKILDGTVIQENFEAVEGQLKGFKGTSISVFNPNTKTWFQTWMDNQGSNLNFRGEVAGDKKIFKTSVRTVNGNQVVSRMVFYDVTENSLTWDWERSQDGGETWTLNWRIYYKKID